MDISRPDVARRKKLRLTLYAATAVMVIVVVPVGVSRLEYQRALIEFDRTQRAALGGAGIAVIGGATRPGVQAPESRLTSGTSLPAGR